MLFLEREIKIAVAIEEAQPELRKKFSGLKVKELSIEYDTATSGVQPGKPNTRHMISCDRQLL